jgi:cytochrome P450
MADTATVERPAARRRLEDLPAPPGLPFVGQTFAAEPSRLHRQLEAWRDACGDVFRVQIGSRRFLVVADPEATAAALRDRPAGMGRTSRTVAASARMGFPGVFSVNGEHWRRQRSMVMAALDPAHIKTYFPSLARVTGRFAGHWGRAADDGRPIELTSDLMRYTVDAISGLAFGVDINTIETEGDVIQRHLDQILPAFFRNLMSPVPAALRALSPAQRRVNVAVREVGRAVQDFIAQARARLAADPALRERPRNLIEAMLVEREKPDSQLDDADLAGNVMTMLLAGEDTTANTLAWMIYLLSRNPEALAKARAEVDGVLQGERWPQGLEQLSKLDYVEACAHETMRQKPVAPIIVQQTHRPSVVAGVELPADALVIFLMRSGSLDARHFPEPQRFEPARWLEGGGADAGSAKRVAMPFGAGPRICPGRYLALVEIKMVAAMLLAGFEIESVDTPDGGDAVERLALTMSPVGLKLRLRRR